MIDTASILGPATVTDATGLSLVLPDGTRGMAQLALAVPYTPEVGDRVLVIGQEPDELYVIGVLQGTGKTTLKVPGDLDVEAPNGTIRFSAPTVEIKAEKLNIFTKRILQKAKNVYLWFTGLFEVKSKRMRTQVEETYRLKAERADIRGENEVNINGPSINLG